MLKYASVAVEFRSSTAVVNSRYKSRWASQYAEFSTRDSAQNLSLQFDGVMWARRDSNPHAVRHQFLRLACLPFHHSPGLLAQEVAFF